MDQSPIAGIRSDIRYAWRGAASLIVDLQGRAGEHPLSGFYFRQARFLSRLRLEIDGEAPYLCSIAEVAPHELELGFIYPEVESGGGGGSGSGGSGMKGDVLYRGLDLRLRYRVHPASLVATLIIANRWQERVNIDVAWVLDADYATVDEAQFAERQQEGPVAVEAAAGGVRFRYGHPRLPFETHVTAEGASWRWAEDRLITRVSLDRQQPLQLELVARAVDFQDSIDPAGEALREERLERWHGAVVRLRSPGETPLCDITNRAMRDLGSASLLEGPQDEWLTPGAGVPLYQTIWGRDAVTSSWQAAILDRGEMLGDALTYLTRRQGERIDPSHDEEPGRIINQAKTDPLSRLGVSPFARYYADYASPLAFVIGVGYEYALTGSRELVARRWEAARHVLEWAEEYGDRDGDGYLEYLTSAPQGPTHQGWKDSENAVVDETGRQIEPPIAPAEIQGYYYTALQFMAVLSLVMKERKLAAQLWRQARRLKERFNRDFWMEDEGFLAFGLDAEKRQIRALTSNAGQCLPTGIVDDAHVPRLVERLFAPDLFSGWGVRTLSTGNPAYHPLDYHLGSVWPVENGTILFGLRRYGLNDRAAQLARSLYELAGLWPGGRTPECVGGYTRDELAHPSAYPRANTPQTWNQTVFPLLTQSLLGLVPVAPLRLLLVDPLLPEWLPDLTLERLRVGEASVTLRFVRGDKGEATVEVLDKEGDLRIVRQPWIQSMSATWPMRLRGLVGV